ncbi:hypothetical protein IAU60_004345 [Kwoniella sp. DSM 27419]
MSSSSGGLVAPVARSPTAAMAARSTPPPPYRSSSPEQIAPASQPGEYPSTLAHHQHSGESSASGSGSASGSASSSSHAYRRASSAASTQHSSHLEGSSVFVSPDLSTAPTTPAASTPALLTGVPLPPAMSRSWRPTPNVPAQLHRRHRRMGSNDDDGNRWLSEDEGAAGSHKVRRRGSLGGAGSGSTSRRDRNPHDRAGDAGPSTLANRARGQKVTTTEEAAAVVSQAKAEASSSRPRPVRARSFEPRQAAARSTVEPADEQVTQGVALPTIEQLVPPPVSDAPIGLGIRSSGAQAPPYQSIPDFASGRGGDGIGGVSLPAGAPGIIDTIASRRERRKSLVEKLRRILGCALCPPVDGHLPTLHHPITLPCGHTLSSSHISIPAPPPLRITNEAPHEVFAAQQRQQLQRLALWTGVLCPIPSCKRYSPNASVSGILADPAVVAGVDGRGDDEDAPPRSPIASTVAYYPPASSAAPPAYTTDDRYGPNGSPLLDICIDKILALVHRELDSEDVDELEMMRGEETDISSSDDDEPRQSSSQLSRAMSRPGSSGSSLGSAVGMARTSSKRRRARGAVRRPRPTFGGPRTASPEWPFEKDLGATLECDVCAMLLYEPVTTPCQHTFCRKCLSRSLDHSSRCPVCRQDLPSFAFFQDHATNKVITSIIKTAFPAEYAERQQGIERDERDARLDTPIFVSTLAFPGMPTILHVFEPRYRLMIRRCIESPSPRFGMILPARAAGDPQLQGVSEYGTMLEIQSVQMLPDGRSMVETVGLHRFKLLEKGNLDGYTVGRIERIDDVSPEEEVRMEKEAVDRALTRAATSTTAVASGLADSASASTIPGTSSTASDLTLPPPAPLAAPGMGGGGLDFAAMAAQAANAQSAPAPTVDDTPETTAELMAICQTFIEQLRSGSAPWLLQRLNNTYGVMPTNPGEFSYWMALVMPIDEYEKAKLLPIRSARLRLKLIVHWIESLRSSWW